MNTEVLQDAMDDLLLLNSVFLDNHKFYEIFARDVVISELNDPVRQGLFLFGCRYKRLLQLGFVDWSTPATDCQCRRLQLMLVEELPALGNPGMSVLGRCSFPGEEPEVKFDREHGRSELWCTAGMLPTYPTIPPFPLTFVYTPLAGSWRHVFPPGRERSGDGGGGILLLYLLLLLLLLLLLVVVVLWSGFLIILEDALFVLVVDASLTPSAARTITNTPPPKTNLPRVPPPAPACSVPTLY